MNIALSVVLLDTDVFSFLMKPRDTRATLYKKHVENKTPAISFITVGELLYGAAKKGWKQERVEDLKARIARSVIVPYDYDLCSTYADLKARIEKNGKVVALHDLWIAACAVRHSIPLVTNNRRHFMHVPDLVLISEAPIVEEVMSQQELELGRQE